MRYLIAPALAGPGLYFAVAGFLALKSSDPYGRWAALAAMALGLALTFGSVMVLAGARNRIVSMRATGVLALLVLGELATKVVKYDRSVGLRPGTERLWPRGRRDVPDARLGAEGGLRKRYAPALSQFDLPTATR